MKCLCKLWSAIYINFIYYLSKTVAIREMACLESVNIGELTIIIQDPLFSFNPTAKLEVKQAKRRNPQIPFKGTHCPVMGGVTHVRCYNLLGAFCQIFWYIFLRTSKRIYNCRMIVAKVFSNYNHYQTNYALQIKRQCNLEKEGPSEMLITASFISLIVS